MNLTKLSENEKSNIFTTLAELREHFKEWKETHPNPLDLCAFAYYEGCSGTECCNQILELAAPLALGNELVNKVDYSWVKIDGKVGLSHPNTGPITINTIKTGKWYSPEDLDDDDIEEVLGQCSPGEICIDPFRKLKSYAETKN